MIIIKTFIVFSHPASTSKMESEDLTNVNNDMKIDHSQENMAYLQLSYLCQSYRDINQTNTTSNPTNTLTIIGNLSVLLFFMKKIIRVNITK